MDNSPLYGFSMYFCLAYQFLSIYIYVYSYTYYCFGAMNNIAMNTHVHTVCGHMVPFLGTAHLNIALLGYTMTLHVTCFPQWHFVFPAVFVGSSFLTFLTTFFVASLFKWSSSSWCWWCWTPFLCHFEKNWHFIFCPFYVELSGGERCLIFLGKLSVIFLGILSGTHAWL